jgi:cytochrome P450
MDAFTGRADAALNQKCRNSANTPQTLTGGAIVPEMEVKLRTPMRRTNVPKRLAELLVSPKAYARRTALTSGFKWLRANAPVAIVEVEGFDRFWAVTRYSDISYVSSNSQLFRNGDRSTTLVPRLSDKRVRMIRDGAPHMLRTLIQMDDPDHRSYRAIMQGWFSHDRIKRLEPLIRDAAREILQEFERAGSLCDLVQMARLYTVTVLLRILGAPNIDHAKLLRLARLLFDSGEKRGTAPYRSAEDPARHAETLRAVYCEFDEYFSELIGSEGKSLEQGFLATLSGARIDGAPIGRLEAVSYFALLSTAGHDTAASAIAGGLCALCENRDELKKLKVCPNLIPQLVNEAVRWTTPVQHFMRTAAEDVVIDGQDIAAGDWLMLCYLSANRDETMFLEPDRFHIHEASRQSLAFGYGPHMCLGKLLAQVEMRIFFEEFLDSVLDMKLVSRPQRSSSIFVGGPQFVPVQLTWASKGFPNCLPIAGRL